MYASSFAFSLNLLKLTQSSYSSSLFLIVGYSPVFKEKVTFEESFGNKYYIANKIIMKLNTKLDKGHASNDSISCTLYNFKPVYSDQFLNLSLCL